MRRWTLVVAIVLSGVAAIVVANRSTTPPSPDVRALEHDEEPGELEEVEPLSRAQLRAFARSADGGPAIRHRGGRVLGVTGIEPQRLDTGVTAGEPTMGVARDGTLFYVGIGFNAAGSAQSTPMRSRDGGRTWQEMDVLVPGTNVDTQSLDPFMYLDRTTQRLFNVDLLLPCSAVSYSDDGGDTWSFGEVCNHTDHQNLFTGPPPDGAAKPSGYPNVVYYCSIDGGALGATGTFTGCSKSLDGGDTFQRTLGIPFMDDPNRSGGTYGIPGHCTGATGHGVAGPDGTVYLPRGWCDQPYLAISHDEGDSWERVQVADIGVSVGDIYEEHEASVAVDPDGNLYYVWPARDHMPYLVTSQDGGKSWSKPVRIAPPDVNESWNVFVEAGDTGRIATVYVATTNSPGGPYCVETTPQGCVTADGSPPKSAADYQETTWNGYMSISTDALSPNPTFTTATVNPPEDPLIRGTCGPFRCQQEFDFLDVQIAEDGTPYAALVDGCPAQAETPTDCPITGAGIVTRLVGAPKLRGPLPPPAPVAPPPPAAPASCSGRGQISVRLPRGARRARATVNGRRIRVVRRRGRLVARAPVRGLPRGRVTVRVVYRAGNRRRTLVRRVRTCGR